MKIKFRYILYILLFLYFFKPLIVFSPLKTNKTIYKPGESVEIDVKYFAFYGINYDFDAVLFCDGGQDLIAKGRHHLPGGYHNTRSAYNQIPNNISGQKCRFEFPIDIKNSLIWIDIMVVPYTQWFTIGGV